MSVIRSKGDMDSILKKALDDEKVVNAVRQLLGDTALSSSKVYNWVERGFPDTLLEGAALIHHYGSLTDEAVRRTDLSARSVWHVFYLEDNSTTNNQDCTVWRFWEGMSAHSNAPRTFTHTTLVDQGKGYRDFTSIGDSNTPMKQFEAYKEKQEKKEGPFALSCSCIVPPGSPYDVGYQVSLIEAMQCKADDHKCHEFLGGINVVSVQRSYLLACIPERMISRLVPPPAWLSFAPQVNPIAFMSHVVSKSELDSLIDRKSDVYSSFEPWGKYGSMEPWTGQIELPKPLAESLPEKWDREESGDRKQRVLFAAFDDPPPLTFQAMVYRLPLSVNLS